MVTPTELTSWTGVILTAGEIAVYEPAAIQRLRADCGSITGPAYTQAICYLIAWYHANAQTSEQFGSESIGGYSYSRIVKDVAYWEGKYLEVISAASAASSVPQSGGCRRIDKHVVHLGGRGLR